MKKKEQDYKQMFWFGIILMGTGVTFATSLNGPLGTAFIVLGGLFMAVGGKNKDKWKN